MSTKKKVEFSDYANEIVKALPKGILLTTKAGDKINTMTIGWGTLGMNWGKPMFVAYLREHRFTMEMLEKNPEFTVNIPISGIYNKDIIMTCGRMHGNEGDKVKEAGLTTVDSDVVSVPGFEELPLTLECKVVYKQLQDKNLYPEDMLKIFYPQDVDSSAPGANRDAHYCVYGEIVNAYVVEK